MTARKVQHLIQDSIVSFWGIISAKNSILVSAAKPSVMETSDRIEVRDIWSDDGVSGGPLPFPHVGASFLGALKRGPRGYSHT